MIVLAPATLGLGAPGVDHLLNHLAVAGIDGQDPSDAFRVTSDLTDLDDATLAVLAPKATTLCVVFDGRNDAATLAELYRAQALGFTPMRVRALVRLDGDRLANWRQLLAFCVAERLDLDLDLALDDTPETTQALIEMFDAYLASRRWIQVAAFEDALRAEGASLNLFGRFEVEGDRALRPDGTLVPLPRAPVHEDRALAGLRQVLHLRLQAELAASVDLLTGGAGADAPLLGILRERRHPADSARIAAQTATLYEMGGAPDRETAAQRLAERGVAPSVAAARATIAGHFAEIEAQKRLNNVYFHVSYRCQMSCEHCYSSSGGHQNAVSPEMSPEALRRLLREAHTAGFRQAVITGGEPLFHRERWALLRVMRDERQAVKPTLIVMRTNFFATMSEDDLREIAASVDKIVVSIDGDEQTHDERRGKGAYRRTVENMEAYQRVRAGLPDAADLMLAAALTYQETIGEQGASVRALAARLGVSELRLNQTKPFGRAAEGDHHPPYPTQYPAQRLRLMNPSSTCGLGAGLYVAPAGEAYPCNFYHGAKHEIGNVLTTGLGGVLDSPAFRNLRTRDVETNRKCSTCNIRYLCGMRMCRVAGGAAALADFDAPLHCEGTPFRNTCEQQVALAGRFLEGLAAEPEGARG